jgi:hypothetical protein
MNRLVIAAFAGMLLLVLGAISAQQRPADAPPLVEAKKEVIVNWTLGGQAWDFKPILTAYEPVKGSFDPITNKATWTLQLVKDFQKGDAQLHQNKKGTPFQPIFLNVDRTVMAKDAPVEITAISGKMGDTIQMDVTLPDPETLAAIKYIRIDRRDTNVGF